MAAIKSNEGIQSDAGMLCGEGPYAHYAPQSDGGMGKIPAISTKSEGFNNHTAKGIPFSQ